MEGTALTLRPAEHLLRRSFLLQAQCRPFRHKTKAPDRRFMRPGAFYVSRGCSVVKRKSVVEFFPVPVTPDQGFCKCFKHTVHLFENLARSEKPHRVSVLADLSHEIHVIMPCFSEKLLHFVPPYYRNCLSGAFLLCFFISFLQDKV